MRRLVYFNINGTNYNDGNTLITLSKEYTISNLSLKSARVCLSNATLTNGTQDIMLWGSIHSQDANNNDNMETSTDFISTEHGNITGYFPLGIINYESPNIVGVMDIKREIVIEGNTGFGPNIYIEIGEHDNLADETYTHSVLKELDFTEGNNHIELCFELELQPDTVWEESTAEEEEAGEDEEGGGE